MTLFLDYSLKTAEERKEYVEELLNTIPQPDTKTLSYLSDYMLFINDKDQTKKERKEEHPITTKNREVTIEKRQVSYEGIVSTLENGEDGLYTMIRNDKNQILDPRDPISQRDIEEIPGMREHFEVLNQLQFQFDKATGPARRALKKAIIESWQQAYLLKASWYGLSNRKTRPTGQIRTFAHIELPEDVYFDDQGYPRSNAKLSLLNPAHVSFLLCYYPQLKEECWDDFQCDLHYLLLDLEQLTEDALLEKYPLLWDLVVWKVDGLTNEEIQFKVDAKYGEWHTEQYYSSLWRKRIPKLIVEEAQRKYLIWYYTNIEKGYWKKCTKCGEIKLGHPMFFSKNSTPDNFYSQCKECKNKKNK